MAERLSIFGRHNRMLAFRLICFELQRRHKSIESVTISNLKMTGRDCISIESAVIYNRCIPWRMDLSFWWLNFIFIVINRKRLSADFGLKDTVSIARYVWLLSGWLSIIVSGGGNNKGKHPKFLHKTRKKNCCWIRTFLSLYSPVAFFIRNINLVRCTEWL